MGPARRLTLRELLRSGHAKIALLAAFSFVPILALHYINGPGGVAAAARPFLTSAAATVRLLGGVVPAPELERAAADEAAAALEPRTGNIFEVAFAARARERA